jgi:hypothetical protein
VAAGAHAGGHAGQVALGAVEAAEPHQHVVRARGIPQAPGDGGAAQGGLEGMVAALGQGLIEPAQALAPGQAAGLVGCGQARGDEFTRVTVGVEPGEALAGEQVAADGALAGAVDAGQHEKDGARVGGLLQ